MVPTLGNGKICYLVLPAIEIRVSAEFYASVFGWEVRRRDDGTTTFNDGVKQVSGAWVTGVPPATTPGLLVYIMVDDAAATLATIIAHGGRMVRPIDPASSEVAAHFSDPAGNVLGIYQERGCAKAASPP